MTTTLSDPRLWSVDDVGTWLSSLGLARFAPLFAAGGITGQVLLSEGSSFDEARLVRLGVRNRNARLQLLSVIRLLQQSYALDAAEAKVGSNYFALMLAVHFSL